MYTCTISCTIVCSSWYPLYGLACAERRMLISVASGHQCPPSGMKSMSPGVTHRTLTFGSFPPNHLRLQASYILRRSTLSRAARRLSISCGCAFIFSFATPAVIRAYWLVPTDDQYFGLNPDRQKFKPLIFMSLHAFRFFFWPSFGKKIWVD